MLATWVKYGLWSLEGFNRPLLPGPECNAGTQTIGPHSLRARYACVNIVWLTEGLKRSKFSSGAPDSCGATLRGWGIRRRMQQAGMVREEPSEGRMDLLVGALIINY